MAISLYALVTEMERASVPRAVVVAGWISDREERGPVDDATKAVLATDRENRDKRRCCIRLARNRGRYAPGDRITSSWKGAPTAGSIEYVEILSSRDAE